MTTWLTTAEAAAHLKRNEHEVRRNAFDQAGGKHCPPGSIPGYKLGTRWKFDADQLDQYVRGESVTRRPILTRRGRRAS